MQIEFKTNVRPTLGVELELMLVDAASGELVGAGSQLLDEIGAPHPGGQHPKAKHELFECTVEIITGICSTVAEARTDLQATLEEVAEAAGRRGLALVSAGTHPFSLARHQSISPSERYFGLINDMQWPARRLLIFGTHFHVGVASGEESIVVANEIQRHLPLFLGLSASSPFFEDEDTGLASARSKVFESLPTAGLPPVLHGWADFEEFMATLLAARCITSVREVWWDVRPHPDFGTVELRMCDASPTLGEVASLAALAQSAVASTLDRYRSGRLPPRPREWVVRENRWLAARHGIGGTLIVDESGARRPAVDLVQELVDELRPTADRLGCEAELDGVLAILEHGPGYERQRRIVAAGGTRREVVAALVDELERDRPARW